MNKPIIGIVGRENIHKTFNRSILSTDDSYRRAVIEARWNTNDDFANTGL